MQPILDALSPNLPTLATILVGLLAFVTYSQQQRDKKRDAARIILLEIQNAEEHLVRARDSILNGGAIQYGLYVMPTSQWDAYNYLFVRDFDAREWSDITTFYEQCRQYDKLAEHHIRLYMKREDETRVNLYSTLAAYTSTYVFELQKTTTPEEQKEAQDDYEKIISMFADEYKQHVEQASGVYFYQPTRTLETALALISSVRTELSTSSVGDTLKAIVEDNWRKRLFRWLVGGRV